MGDDDVARVAFLHPTSDKMQICRFFLHQQCRFGAKCRLFHGLEIHLKALRSFEPPEWKHVSVRSVVLAEARNGLWEAVELESWDEAQQCASIEFSADGTRVEVLKNDLALSEYASVSDASSDSSASEDDDAAEVKSRSRKSCQRAVVDMGRGVF